MRKNKKYTGEFKEKVVKRISFRSTWGTNCTAKIYDVRNVSQLKKWVKKYREDPTSLHRETREGKKYRSNLINQGKNFYKNKLII